MENYGSDMYLSQEGYPSIDFTLLDRPSSSIVSAPESVAHFPQGDSSFSSFDLFDGAAVEPYNEQSFADHGSYMLDSHKDVMRRHASGQLGAITSQRQGVHNFFEHENQSQKSGSGTWPSNEQSPYFLPRAAGADESIRRPFYTTNSYEPTSHGDHSERSTVQARITRPPVKQMAGDATDHTAFLNVASTMENEARNQTMNAQRFSIFSHSNQLNPCYSIPFNNGTPSHHSTTDSMGYFGAQYQSQVDKHNAPNQAAVAVNNVSSYDFLGNQVPWRGPLQHSQAEASQQLQGSTRAMGFTELQSQQQQLQEMFLGHQLKQLEDSKQQQMLQQAHDQFSRTSYSDLLHGPDTPPSQQQTTGTAIEEYENPAAVLPPQNAEVLGWSVDGPSYYQGFVNDIDMERCQNLASHMSPFGAALDSGCHVGNLAGQTGPALSSYSERQNVMPEYLGDDRRSPSMQQIGKPVLQPCRPGSEHLAEIQTTNSGLGNDWNSEFRRTNPPHGNLCAVQNPQRPAEALSRHKVKGNGFSQVNVFSQSQQHFQELQLNEQRSCSFEQNQPGPSQNFNFLPQISLNSAKSTSKNGMQQGSSNFNTTSNVAGYSSHHLDSTPLDVAATFEPPKWSISSSAGAPSRHTIVEVGGQHQSNPQDSLQTLQPHKGIGFRTWPISDAKYSTLGNSNAHQGSEQGSPMLGVSPGSVKVPVIGQQGFYNIQDSSVNMRASTAGDGFASNQKNSKAFQDFRKEINETNASDRNFQPSSEPASHFQGVWKKYTSPNQFAAGVGPLGQPLDGHIPNHGFHQQGSLNSETSFRTMAMPSNSTFASAQYFPHQHVCEEYLSGKDGQRLERHISQGQAGSLPTPNFMKTLSKQAVKVVPNVVEEVQGLLYQPAEPQDTFLEKQREVPQQQVDSCTASISLAHLRGNQSSNSLSPQHVKLGLGPSHDSQQANDANWRRFPLIQSLDGEVPTLKSAHKTFNAGSPRGASEMAMKNEVEVNQRSSVTVKGMVSQSSATPPSAFINRSSPVLNETTLSAALPPSSFASGHGMGAKAVFSANAIPHSHEYNAGGGPSNTEYRMGGDSSSGVSQVQTNAFNCNSHQDYLNGYIGQSSSISNYSRQPNHSVGAMLVQNQHLINSLRQSNNDGGGMHVMQDHHASNMAVTQQGNRAQAVNLAGMATSTKASVLDQSKDTGIHEQDFSGIVESSGLPSSRARGVGGGAQRDTAQPTQRTQMMWRNPVNRGGEEYTIQTSSIGRQSPLNECDNQFYAYKATPSGNEASGLVSSPSHPNLQEGRLALSPMNGGLFSSLQAGGLSQDLNKYQHTKPVSSFTPETDGVVQNSSRPPLKAGHSVQHMNNQDTHWRQTLEGHESNVRAKRLSESALLSLPQKNKGPLKAGNYSSEPEYVHKWTVNQQAADPRLRTGEQLKVLQQHNAFDLENKVPQPVDMLPLGHSQLPKQLDDSSIAAGSEKNNSLALNTDEKLPQTVSYPANPSHQSLYFVRSKHANLRASGKPSTHLQQSYGNNEAQLETNDDQGKKVPSGLESLTLKEEGVRTPAQGPVSTPNDECPLSPSKVINHVVGNLHSKKRKKQLPLLIPWHIAAAQARIDLPSIRDTELMWASATNRLPEKDASATHEENPLCIYQAKRRLILTTESMQRLFPPLPDGLMHGNTPADNECAIYSLAKIALEDACRLVSKTNGQASVVHTSPATMNMSSQRQAGVTAKNSALAKCVESFMERVKQLGMELARLDCSTSVSELQGETHELEKLSIVNRLAKHHGIGFTMDSSDNMFIENIFEFGLGARKTPLQKYVTPAPMPRTLPGVRCLSL